MSRLADSPENCAIQPMVARRKQRLMKKRMRAGVAAGVAPVDGEGQLKYSSHTPSWSGGGGGGGGEG